MDPILLVAVLLTTLRESPDCGAPAGILYAGLMSNVSLDEFQSIISVLEKGGMVRRSSGHMIFLTDEGKEKADAINATLAS